MTAGPNVLISSAGRRVSLLRAFQQSARSIGLRGQVFACDASSRSAAFHAATSGSVVPRCTSPEFLPELLALCTSRDIGLIVPTIDPELPVLAAAKAQFARAGIVVAVSDLPTAEIGTDKLLTHTWLLKQGFPTVCQHAREALGVTNVVWPLLAKPRFGSASIGIRLLTSRDDLDHLDDKTEYVFQELAQGHEYTVDALVLEGRCVSAVPRRRLEVRAGEVSKAVTCRMPALESLAKAVAEALPGSYGSLNIQIFVDQSQSMSIIEINPRFGGGFPLSYEAGADFPKWLMEDAFGLPLTASNTWRSGLLMLRFDDAVFVDEEALTH